MARDSDPVVISGVGIVSPFGVTPVMNGYDANALEAALKLKEEHGGSITAVCLGDDTSRNTLKRALAMGADRGILVRHDGPLDPEARMARRFDAR